MSTLVSIISIGLVSTYFGSIVGMMLDFATTLSTKIKAITRKKEKELVIHIDALFYQ